MTRRPAPRKKRYQEPEQPPAEEKAPAKKAAPRKKKAS